jgi:hypothetical protein
VTGAAAVLAEAGADPSLRDSLAAALYANRQLAELTGKLREENARLREDNARLLARVAERDAELDRVRADLAVLQRMLFGRSLMALAGSAQRCLSKLLSSGWGEAARVRGAGQALWPLTRRGCWSSVDHVPPDISR